MPRAVAPSIHWSDRTAETTPPVAVTCTAGDASSGAKASMRRRRSRRDGETGAPPTRWGPAAEDVEGHGHGVGAGVAHDEALGARGAGAASDEPGVGCRKAAGGHDEAAVVITRVPPDLGGQQTGRQRARRTRHDRRGGGHGRGDESVDRAPVAMTAPEAPLSRST